MHIVLLSDIFGHTNEFNRLAKEIELSLDSLQIPVSLSILSPYKTVPGNHLPVFSNEAEAYEYFIQNSSVDQYTKVLTAHIEHLTHPHSTTQVCSSLFIIGFSVGASALWAYAGAVDTQGKSGLHDIKVSGIGYYSSQIRKMTDLSPSFPVEFVFPQQEPYFSVRQIIQRIQTHSNVTCRIASSGHGFMNPLSDNFDSKLLKHESTLLIEKLSALID